VVVILDDVVTRRGVDFGFDSSTSASFSRALGAVQEVPVVGYGDGVLRGAVTAEIQATRSLPVHEKKNMHKNGQSALTVAMSPLPSINQPTNQSINQSINRLCLSLNHYYTAAR
jgi:hypothetical protein